MVRFIWIPILIAIYVASAYFSYKNNTEGGKWFWYSYIITAIPIWQIVSRISTDIFFDALVFDIILILSFSITLGYLTHQIFTPQKIVALVLMFGGLILFKL